MKLQLTCANCGSTFDRCQSEYNRQLKRGKTEFYCGKKCSSVGVGKRKTNRVPIVQKRCAWCDKVYQHRELLGVRSGKCCSTECAQKLNAKREIDKWSNHIPQRVLKKKAAPLGWVKGQSFDLVGETARRDKIRQHIQKRYSSGWLPKAGRCKKIKYTSTTCGEIMVDGTWELEVAKWLDSTSFKWKRNTKRFEYFFDGKLHHYTPDFFIETLNLYVEVKGYKTLKDDAKWKQFSCPLAVLRKYEIKKIKDGVPLRVEDCILDK